MISILIHYFIISIRKLCCQLWTEFSNMVLVTSITVDSLIIPLVKSTTVDSQVMPLDISITVDSKFIVLNYRFTFNNNRNTRTNSSTS